MKKPHKKSRKAKLGLALTLLSFTLGLVACVFVFTDRYDDNLAAAGSERLITKNWEMADEAFKKSMPTYDRKYAYYQLKENENIDKVAKHFSVPVEKLAALNEGTPIAGTTIKVPPVEKPFDAVAPNNRLSTAKVAEVRGFVQVKNDYKFDEIVTSIPELAAKLKPYGVFTQTGPKSYVQNRPLLIEQNIRVDITGETVESLSLKSEQNGEIVCLCVKDATILVKDTTITSLDTITGTPDTDITNKRSFIRANASARMDIVNSTISYLGTPLEDNPTNPILNEGGTYGISWRIPDDALGKDIVTGWVEKTTFVKNHFGAYTFGASGMMWRDNIFEENDVYGLDPHDDSNNAMVEGNTFRNNGKHGFIVSKRCNYNIIRNNTSYGNKLHGFMLHQDSVYNLMENNVAYDNVDNFAIYASNFNMIRGNKSYNAKGSHVRINASAANTYVMDNVMYGGNKGVFAYGDARNIYVHGNTFNTLNYVLQTDKANTLVFTENIIDKLSYKISQNDRIIFGPNRVKSAPPAAPSEVGPIVGQEE